MEVPRFEASFGRKYGMQIFLQADVEKLLPAFVDVSGLLHKAPSDRSALLRT